jgi:hypothetical protein
MSALLRLAAIVTLDRAPSHSLRSMRSMTPIVGGRHLNIIENGVKFSGIAQNPSLNA